MTSPDLWRALAVLAEPPERGHADVAAALGLPAPEAEEQAEVFLLQAPPYASLYLGAEGMLGGDARERVAGFWRAVGVMPPPEPDHVAALLGLYASLVELEREETDDARRLLRREARAALLHEHLLSWIVPFLRTVALVAGPACRPWAAMVEDVLVAEAGALGPATTVPLALRETPAPPDTLDGADALVAFALTPVMSGIVLPRRALATFGRESGLGVRPRDRSSALRGLLEQDACLTLRFLAGEAACWGDIHRSTASALGPVAGFWEGRAEAAAARFLEGSAAAEEVTAGAPGS